MLFKSYPYQAGRCPEICHFRPYPDTQPCLHLCLTITQHHLVQEQLKILRHHCLEYILIVATTCPKELVF